MRFVLKSLLLLCVCGPLATQAGDLTGQYILNGVPPKLPPLVAAGAANCAAGAVDDRSLVVDPKSNGIANIVIFLPKAPAGAPPLGNVPAPVLDQKDCQFLPRILTVRAGQVPLVLNADPAPHNVRSSFIRNTPFNFVIGPANRVGLPVNGITDPEPLPMPIKCDLHPYMAGYWVITDHPYVAVTDKDGKFTISDLPAGNYKFRVWHERAGYIERTLKVNVPANGNVALPVVKVPLNDFKVK